MRDGAGNGAQPSTNIGYRGGREGARLAATANGRREDGARRRRLDGARESAELTPEMMELHALTRASLAGARGDLLRSLA